MNVTIRIGRPRDCKTAWLTCRCASGRRSQLPTTCHDVRLSCSRPFPQHTPPTGLRPSPSIAKRSHFRGYRKLNSPLMRRKMPTASRTVSQPWCSTRLMMSTIGLNMTRHLLMGDYISSFLVLSLMVVSKFDVVLTFWTELRRYHFLRKSNSPGILPPVRTFWGYRWSRFRISRSQLASAAVSCTSSKSRWCPFRDSLAASLNWAGVCGSAMAASIGPLCRIHATIQLHTSPRRRVMQGQPKDSARLRPLKYHGRVIESMNQELLRNSRLLITKPRHTISRSEAMMTLAGALMARIRTRRAGYR